MKQFLFFLLIPLSLFGQNRVFDRPVFTGRAILFDKGGGELYEVREQRYNFDSTEVHVSRMNSDLVMSHIGGVRFAIPLSWMNDAAALDDGVIIGGTNIGFSTVPYVLRMDTAGNVVYSLNISNTTPGQNQILTVDMAGDKLDLFTWADGTRPSFNMINGFTDGTFNNVLQVIAPSGTEMRVDDSEPSGNSREFLVVCQADSGSSIHDFLYVMLVDSSGVQWSFVHDHGTTMNFELEQGNGIRLLANGDWIYHALFRGTSGNLENRLTRITSGGMLVWSKEFFEGTTKLSVGFPYVTTDNGFLVSAANSVNGGQYVLKLDAAGTVMWSQKFQAMSITGIPMGSYFKTDQGQMYSYHNTQITEMDETINVCDMVPHTGITSMNATFNLQAVTLTSNTFVPIVQPISYSMRTANYANTQSCISIGVEEVEEDLSVSIYPNPTSELLNIEFSNTEGRMPRADITIYDLLGNRVKVNVILSNTVQQADVSKLTSGVYIIEFISESVVHRQSFVKE